MDEASEGCGGVVGDRLVSLGPPPGGGSPFLPTMGGQNLKLVLTTVVYNQLLWSAVHAFNHEYVAMSIVISQAELLYISS